MENELLAENVTVPESSQDQEDCSGESEKNDIEVCDEKKQKQGLFDKVRKIFTA